MPVSVVQPNTTSNSSGAGDQPPHLEQHQQHQHHPGGGEPGRGHRPGAAAADQPTGPGLPGQHTGPHHPCPPTPGRSDPPGSLVPRPGPGSAAAARASRDCHAPGPRAGVGAVLAAPRHDAGDVDVDAGVSAGATAPTPATPAPAPADACRDVRRWCAGVLPRCRVGGPGAPATAGRPSRAGGRRRPVPAAPRPGRRSTRRWTRCCRARPVVWWCWWGWVGRSGRCPTPAHPTPSLRHGAGAGGGGGRRVVGCGWGVPRRRSRCRRPAGCGPPARSAGSPRARCAGRRGPRSGRRGPRTVRPRRPRPGCRRCPGRCWCRGSPGRAGAGSAGCTRPAASPRRPSRSGPRFLAIPSPVIAVDAAAIAIATPSRKNSNALENTTPMNNRGIRHAVSRCRAVMIHTQPTANTADAKYRIDRLHAQRDEHQQRGHQHRDRGQQRHHQLPGLLHLGAVPGGLRDGGERVPGAVPGHRGHDAVGQVPGAGDQELRHRRPEQHPGEPGRHPDRTPSPGGPRPLDRRRATCTISTSSTNPSSTIPMAMPLV